jgi:hypothetical protein
LSFSNFGEECFRVCGLVLLQVLQCRLQITHFIRPLCPTEGSIRLAVLERLGTQLALIERLANSTPKMMSLESAKALGARLVSAKGLLRIAI